MGNIDLFYLLITVFGLGIGVILAVALSNNVVAGLNQSVGGSNVYIQKAAADVNATFLLFDVAIVELFFGLSLLSIGTAFLIRSHPIFYFFNLIAIIIVMAVAPSISNAFFDFISNPSIASTATIFPNTIILFENLPLFLLIISILIAVATLAKGGSQTVDAL